MTSENDGFVQPAIPRFDGHYDHWAMLMENFLRSKEYWSIVENGIPATAEEGGLSDEQKKVAADLKVKRAQLQALRKDFETLHMKVGESVTDYFGRTLTIANKMRISGEKMDDVVVIEKILRSMSPKFDYVVCSIEESNDLDKMTIDELQSSLLVHEQRMHSHEVEEQALKVSHEEYTGGRGRGRGGSGFRGRGRGRGRQIFDKSMKGSRVHYAEAHDEMLLMAYVEDKKAYDEEAWFLDSGCSNHMCGKRELFSQLNEEFRESVKLGNNSSLSVVGKGNI
ncbi:uncharacterized protein LOC120008755 [Tripterygium wilfordii]|uniref:uncharacterized protein LOC120008755 n=1 Tax=Tripterygium wilfordii TaxID=458696 RepID=UPI0018F80EFD|nr:uncharacterized protein LOC120008755 [Tripterygium wilfordii]